MSTFKLAIGNFVDVPMTVILNDGGKPAIFKFTLEAKRLDQETMQKRIDEGQGEKVSVFLNEVITGWRSQRLILDESDKPAEFSEEALQLMWSIPGVSLLAYQNYAKEIQTKEKT
jgi:hypothetical protein